MKRFYTSFLLSLFISACIGINAQERYLDPVFADVKVTSDIVYSANATVLFLPIFGEAIQIPLAMDVYEPVGDTETERPLVFVYHTGNFLPPVTNGQISGSRKDSSVVEICNRFAQAGYVAAAIDYRLGWNPLASTQPERALGLIQAAYRALQDARTAIRFFRADAIDGSNTFGIDVNSVTAFGLGTGGYLALAVATVDDYTKVVQTQFPVGKFLLDLDGNGIPETPMVVPAYHGDINGEVTSVTPDGAFGLPAGDTTTYSHFVGYSSDINLAVNVGGALGDLAWIDEDTPPIISIQSPYDIFAPYDDATVIVPTTGDPVIRAQGSLAIARRQAELGNTDLWENAVFTDYASELAVENSMEAGHDFYISLLPWIQPPNALGIDEGVNLNWWDPNAPSPPDGQGMGIPWNQLPHPSGGTYHEQGLVLFMDMSAEVARANVDTVMTFVLPRACVALELPCADNFLSTTEELLPASTEISVYPNPVVNDINIRTEDGLIEAVEILSVDGKVLRLVRDINNVHATLNISEFETGAYLLKIYLEEGLVTRQVIKE